MSLLTVENAKLKPGRNIEINKNASPSWMSSRYSSSPEDWMYLNFYSEYEKYPGYGIAEYSCDSMQNKEFPDIDLLRDAARIIKIEYGNGFVNKSIMRWSDNESKNILFNPEYIAIILADRTRKHYCGIIVKSSDLFTLPNKGIEQPSIQYDNIFVVDYPPGQNASSFSPNQAYRYKFIETHIEKQRRVKWKIMEEFNKAVQTEPVTCSNQKGSGQEFAAEWGDEPSTVALGRRSVLDAPLPSFPIVIHDVSPIHASRPRAR
ncbi:MAG: hypothetical protein IPO35_17635 [Uliginosibacterium sp.]|nr:hypothetical protein [Uliginosibacterium sp.]